MAAGAEAMEMINCHRMSARITPQACDRNKASGRYLACEGCAQARAELPTKKMMALDFSTRPELWEKIVAMGVEPENIVEMLNELLVCSSLKLVEKAA
jgi:hypothetical protein